MRFADHRLLPARLLLAVGLAVLPAVAQAQRFPKAERPVAPVIAPAYSTEEARDRAGEAQRVMDRLRIAPGARVADIGAGAGYYTVHLARRLGPGAKIYAEDIEQKYLDQLDVRLAQEGIRASVTLVRGTPNNPGLPERSIDVAILAHMYHEIENPYEFLYRLRPALAQGGRVAIIDLDQPTRDHGTPLALLRCELAAVGYREVDFAVLAPADGYVAVFEPPDQQPAAEKIRPCRR